MFRGPPPDLSRFHSVLVNNLSEETTPDDLNALFKTYGEVGDVYVPRDRDSRNGYKNFGFVRFLDKANADAALDADGTELHGNKIGVQEAKYGRRERESRDRRGGYGSRDRDYRGGYDQDYRGYDDRRPGGYHDRRPGGGYDDRWDDRRPGGYGGGRGYDDRRREYSRSRSPRGGRSRSPGRGYRD